MELPRYIPLTEAAQRYNLDHAELTQAVDTGKIVAARLNGTIVVAEADMQALALDPSLVGVPIRSNDVIGHFL